MTIDPSLDLFYGTLLLQNQAHANIALNAPLFPLIFTPSLTAQTLGDPPLIFELGQSLLMLSQLAAGLSQSFSQFAMLRAML